MGMGMGCARRRTIAIVCGCVGLATLALTWPDGPPEPDPMVSAVRLTVTIDQPVLAKAHIVDELVRGDLTLQEGVDRCEELYRRYPEATEISRRVIDARYEGRSFNDRLAQNLLEQCAKRLESDPELAA